MDPLVDDPLRLGGQRGRDGPAEVHRQRVRAHGRAVVQQHAATGRRRAPALPGPLEFQHPEREVRVRPRFGLAGSSRIIFHSVGVSRTGPAGPVTTAAARSTVWAPTVNRGTAAGSPAGRRMTARKRASSSSMTNGLVR
ncbi:hypothetical protein GCM10009759_64120 [Kitasatospora saccharophila]|uniref:Uncharacterized protein n=1 Tax=Kitasatospora saccharophila TaxID=407973 RepID=A0ABN2XVB6_9ACTN